MAQMELAAAPFQHSEAEQPGSSASLSNSELLGLGIVKSIVDKHGGSIAITFAPDEGTEVMVTLPRALVPQPSTGKDNPTNCALAPVERS